jgi:hypothetical protein
MSTTTTTSPTLARYATALLPLAIGVLGILQAAQSASTGTLLDWQTITQILLLLVGTGVVYWLPILPSGWQGAAKTGAAVLFAVISAVVALVPDGHFTRTNVILVITAVVKAAATELGVFIRTDAETITGTSGAAVSLASDASSNLDLSTLATHTTDDAGNLTAVAVGASETEQSGTVPNDGDGKHVATAS